MTVIVIYNDTSVLAKPCSSFHLDADMGSCFIDREEVTLSDVSEVIVDGTRVFCQES